MKSFVMIFSLFIFIHPLIFGKIINGYDTRIQEARIMLINLQAMFKEDTDYNKSLSFLQKNRLKASIKRVTTYISHYHLTEILLDRFRTMAPDLYHEINVITDAKGRRTDVYVKFMPEKEMQISLTGTAAIAQGEDDTVNYILIILFFIYLLWLLFILLLFWEYEKMKKPREITL